MTRRLLRTVLAGLAAALAAVLVLSGCSMKGSSMDAAQKTQSEAEQLTLEQQFGLLGDRYERMQDLLLDTQLRIADADTSWVWISSGVAPSQGNVAPTALAGGNANNSYFLDARRAIRLPGASGVRSDLDPVIDFFSERGWEAEVEEDPGNAWNVRARTDDGYLVRYSVQQNGQYNLAIFSGTFWGDTQGLLGAAIERVPKDQLATEESLPGEFAQFPKWSDPVLTSVQSSS